MLNQETLLLVQIGFTLLIVAVLSSVALYADSLREQRLWALGNVVACLGLALGALTGFPPLIHAVLSYGVMALGMGLVLLGLRLFCRQELAWGWIAAIVAAALALSGYFALIEPNLPVRLAVTGLYFGGLNWVCAATLVRHADDRGVWLSVFGFAALGVSLMVRGGYLLAHPYNAAFIDAVLGISMLAISLGQVCIAFGLILMTMRRYAERLRQLSALDHLTGVLNRAELEVRGQKIVQWAAQHHRSVAVLMIDADNFKQINDTYGHPVGDEVLRHLSGLLIPQMRPHDLLARYGGEEFVLVFGGMSLAAAMVVSERLRRMLEQQSLSVDGHTIRYTVSMGVASSDEHGYNLAQLISASDAAMYAAKKAGRNRVNSG